MKYSDVKDIIVKKVNEYSKSIDEAINTLNNVEEIAISKNMN